MPSYDTLEQMIQAETKGNGDREVGLKAKMELVQLHYIDCTEGVDACHICELVNQLMEDYTCSEIMEDIEVD